MRIIVRTLICLAVLSASHFFTPQVFAQSTSIPIISSKHKFSIAHKTAQTPPSNNRLVLLKQRKNLIKKRPAQRRNIKLASTKRLRRKLSAKSAVVIDASNGKSLYSHAPDLPGQPASTIKVLTGLIAIDSLQNNELVKVSRRAARMPRSKIYLQSGKKYMADDLINAVLLASANDASVALAEKIAGSEQIFSKLMTAKAKSFGASSTICKTASGLTAKGQKSTARDLAKIFRMAMHNDQFAEKMARTKIQTSFGKTIRSHNKALWQVKGAEGGKTGYTNLARQTYVGKFKRETGEIIVAIMGSETMWDDVKRLVEFGFNRKEHLNQRLHASTLANDPPIKLVQLTPRMGNSSPKIILSSLSKQSSL